MHISSHSKLCLVWFGAKDSERCEDNFLLSCHTMLVNNWFLYYPNCWATSGEGEGGNLRGTGLISFLINGSLLPNAAIKENPANFKHSKMERLNIPQRKANGIQSFSPQGHKLKSGSSQKQQDSRLLLSWVEGCSSTSQALTASQGVLRNNPLHTSPALNRDSNFCMQNVLQPQHISVEDEVEIHCPGCLFKFQRFHLLSWLTAPNPVLCTNFFYSRCFSYCFCFI